MNSKRKLKDIQPTTTMSNERDKCNHTDPKMGYIQWMDYSATLFEKGEKQTKCGCCGKFVWDSEWKKDEVKPINN